MKYYCKKCGQHFEYEETIHDLEDDCEEHFYCKSCDIELFKEFELEDSDLDEMMKIKKEIKGLKEELSSLEYRFIKHKKSYYNSWHNNPVSLDD